MIIRAENFKNTILALSILSFIYLTASMVSAADSAAVAKQIQRNLGTVKRHIVTQPKNAGTELAETFALFEELKAVDPGNADLPRLEGELNKLDADLAKRLGKSVKPLAKAPPAAAPAPTAAKPAAAAPVSVTAAAGDKLPSAVQSRIMKIDQSLDKAKKALANNSIQRAELEFKAATGTYDEIQARYPDQAPADHPEMIAVAGRMAGVNAQIEAAASGAAADQAVGTEAAAVNQALADAWIAKMKPFTTRDSNKYLDPTGWGKGDAEFAKIRQSYGEAAVVFAEDQKVDFPQGKPMALKNSENRLQSVLDDLRETYAQQDTAKASEAWLSRLEPYVTSMGQKTLIVAFTSSVEDMQRQKAIFDEATKAFAAYQKADFPLGKSPELQQVEGELADRLAKFPETLQRSMNAQSSEAEQKLDQEIAFLESKQEWRSDASKRPYCLSDERIGAARKLVDTAAGLLPAGDPSLARIQEKLAKLVKMNDERRQVNAERTRMEPDRFTGDGKGDIKAQAKSLVVAKISGCKVLRCTVISDDWKEESVQEWTDTTHSAVRNRTTRSVTAQVAAKKANGEVRLYTLAIAKDRRSDGAWGKLYGNLHSDLGDLMLEKNVDQ